MRFFLFCIYYILLYIIMHLPHNRKRIAEIECPHFRTKTKTKKILINAIFKIKGILSGSNVKPIAVKGKKINK